MGGQTRNAGGGTDDSRCGDDVVCYEDFPVPLVQEAAASFLNACCLWFFKIPLLFCHCLSWEPRKP